MVTPLLDASLDAGDPVEGNIEQAVEDKADNVQGDKVKVEADHALPPPILVNLQGVQKGTSWTMLGFLPVLKRRWIVVLRHSRTSGQLKMLDLWPEPDLW